MSLDIDHFLKSCREFCYGHLNKKCTEMVKGAPRNRTWPPLRYYRTGPLKSANCKGWTDNKRKRDGGDGSGGFGGNRGTTMYSV